MNAVHPVACALAIAVTLLLLPDALARSKIHACPQADGTVRYQDRPCAETARTAPRDAPRGDASPRNEALQPPAGAERAEAPAARGDYIELNAARCREGDRRACAAVTCERSGDLASRECQAAVGWLSGPGWRARPRGDLYAPGVTADDYELRCGAGRILRFLLAREGVATSDDAQAPPGRPRVSRADLERFARERCTG